MASLILTGIHAYLGVHVVERGVIFVDLALAQIAALGATIAILVGMDPHGRGAYWLSLAFTFMGAADLRLRAHTARPYSAGSLHRNRVCRGFGRRNPGDEQGHRRDRAPERHAGRQHPGRVRHEVVKTAMLYGAVGLFHYIFRHKFLLISTDPGRSRSQGINIRFWDFLFYASFGFVVTSSVAIAGVLLVFCYLIVPSVGAMLFRRPRGPPSGDRLDDGNAGFCARSLFLCLFDLPTGAAIVCTFGAVLILMFCRAS